MASNSRNDDSRLGSGPRLPQASQPPFATDPRRRGGDDYTEFSAALRQLTGVDLGAYKRRQMERRVRRYASGHQGSLDGFLDAISRDAILRDRFLDAITIHVSALYREPDQYRTLRDAVLPGLFRRRRVVRAWSAGCSYGAEAYTLACVIADALPVQRQFLIDGTDIDSRVLDRAGRGWFTAGEMRNVPHRIRQRYFEPSYQGWQAGRELRQRLRFRRHDLLAEPYRDGWDVIVCRNVVIYFTDPARDAVHRLLAGSLAPGGYLVIGANETVTDPASIGLVATEPCIFQRC